MYECTWHCFSLKKTNCEMLTVNISASAGTSTKHSTDIPGICQVELALKREFASHILDRKCADIKYGAHIFIPANSKCHLTTFKEAGKVIHFQPKDNFPSCFPWIFLFENPLRFPAEESLLIFRWCKSYQDYGLRVASVGKGRDAINLCELKYTSFH